MNFQNIVQTLQENKVDFFVTGSFAVFLYTRERSYNDIDLVVKAEDFSRLEDLFNVKREVNISPFNHEYAAIKVGNVEFCDYNIKDGENNYFFGLDSRFMNYEEFEFEGTKFKVITPEELVIFKIFHNRKLKGKRDLEDVKLLVRHLDLDWSKIIVQSIRHKSFKGLLEIMTDKDIKDLKINLV